MEERLEECMSLMEPLRRIPLLGGAGVMSSMERMEECIFILEEGISLMEPLRRMPLLGMGGATSFSVDFTSVREDLRVIFMELLREVDPSLSFKGAVFGAESPRKLLRVILQGSK